MSIFSAVAATAGDLLSGYINNQYALGRQQQAQNWESSMFRGRYQMQVRDLEAAGLNPMLAYGQGPGSAPSSSAAGAASGELGSKAVEAYNSTRLATAAAAKMDAERRTSETQADLNTAQTATERERPESVRSTVRLLDEQLQEVRTKVALNQRDADLRQAEEYLTRWQAALQKVMIQAEYQKGRLTANQANREQLKFLADDIAGVPDGVMRHISGVVRSLYGLLPIPFMGHRGGPND